MIQSEPEKASAPDDWSDITKDMAVFPVSDRVLRRRAARQSPSVDCELTLQLTGEQRSLLVGMVTTVSTGLSAEARGPWASILERLRAAI